MKINGKEIAEKIIEELQSRVGELKKKPTLAIIQVGDNPASDSYIKQKKKLAERIGIKVIHNKFPENIIEEKLINRVGEYNKKNDINGIIVQLPLPPSLSPNSIISSISLEKDVDGFCQNSPYTPPVACAILSILYTIYRYTKPISNRSKQKSNDKNTIRSYGLNVTNDLELLEWLGKKNIILIGRGKTGGQPIMKKFEKEKVPYKLIHSKTQNADASLKSADIIISCVGKPNIVKAKNIKRGAILISVGIHRESNEKLHGDYDEQDIKDKAAFYTPTPGGVGPLTVTCLMKNVFISICSRCGTYYEPFLIEDLLRGYKFGL